MRPAIGFSAVFVLIVCGIAWTDEPAALTEPSSKANDSAKQISVQCEMFEINLRALRESGVPFPLTPRVLDANEAEKCLDRLIEDYLARKLGESHTFTHDGQMMHYMRGGEIRQGTRKIGTKIGILPRLTKKGRIHLTVSSELDIDADQEASVALRVQTEFDLQDGQVAILESPIHRQTLEEAHRIEGPLGVVLKHQNVSVDMLRLIVVRPTVEHPSK